MRQIVSQAAVAVLAMLDLTGCTSLQEHRSSGPLDTSVAGPGRPVAPGITELWNAQARPGLLPPSLPALPKGGARLYLIEPFDPSRTPVVFVHGAGGSPRDWQSFVDGLDRCRFQAWLFGFPSGKSPEALAGLLYGELSALHAEHPFPALHFAAHSLGGLVVRSFLGRYSERFPYTRLFVSISTPWGGEPLARFAPPEISVWSALNPRGPFVTSLFETRLAPEVGYYLFFSYRGPRRLWGDRGDGTVSLNSELDPRAQAEARKVLGFEEDHTSILSSPEVVGAFNALLATEPPLPPPPSYFRGGDVVPAGSAQSSRSASNPFVAPLR